MVAYHVAPENHEGDLLSLYSLMGDESEAIEEFVKRWPEADLLAGYHVHYVHLFDLFSDAETHARIHGGKIYEVDIGRMEEDFFKVERDCAEFDHPIVRDEIPAEYIRVI